MLSLEIKDLSNYRLERAGELINDAEELYKIGSFKSANNRAYYAIFQSIRALLALEEVDFKKHSGVIQHFQKIYIKTGIFDKRFSDIVMSASMIRNASDYDDFFIASREETETQISSAKELLTAIKEYIGTIL